MSPAPECTLLDIGTGVGFIALPFAKRIQAAKVYGCAMTTTSATLSDKRPTIMVN